MNPDSANQNQKAPRSVTNAGAARRVVKRNILCAGEIYTESSRITGVRHHLQKRNGQGGEFKHFFRQHACHHWG